MNNEQIRTRIAERKVQENDYNKQLAKLEWTIKDCKKKKLKLAKKVSDNMRYRNKLINMLTK